MKNAAPSCARCDQPAPHSTLCRRCTTTLEHAIANISAHYIDLDTIRTKRGRFAGNPTKGSVGRTIPLPIDGRFADHIGTGSEMAYSARTVLVAWTRVVLDEWPPLSGPTCIRCHHRSCNDVRRRRHPADNVIACAAYLIGMSHKLATQRWADEMLDEMLDTERRLAHFVDRPTNRWYAGICGSTIEPARPHDHTTCACACHLAPGLHCDVPEGCHPEITEIPAIVCTRPLSAEPDDPFVRCRDCGTTWDIADRRPIVLAEVRQHNATIKTIVQIATTLAGHQPSARLEPRIKKWAQRGRITQRGTDPKSRPTYRVADVLDLLDRAEHKHTRGA